jgi:hypothetical protein
MAARHARLARLVAMELAKLGPATTTVPDTESGQIEPDQTYRPSDFLLQHLDLRIRLLLILEAKTPTELNSPGYSDLAHRLLRFWPETTAVALVADDDELSCRIVEPFETQGAIGVPSGQVLETPPSRPSFPLLSAVKSYLSSMIPVWHELPPRLASERKMELATQAIEIASDVVAAIKQRKAQIDEKKNALRNLDKSDARWAADLVKAALAGKLVKEQLEAEFRRRAGEAG